MASSFTEVVGLLDGYVRDPFTRALGPLQSRADITSSIGPFFALPEYRTRYPHVVIQALGELYLEYNHAFGPLLAANREWETDYQYCCRGSVPVNFAVQIDMIGLPDSFLSFVETLPAATVREVLRRRIFEIENSLAMYQFLERIFSAPRRGSVFQERFRSALADIRARFNMPIALLAVTDQKYLAMRESEFGCNGELLPDDEVVARSGFDCFFGPAEFQRHVARRGGRCAYLLYARTSDPVAKLKHPDLVVEHPLLSDPELRRIIKAHALTLNVDAPDMDFAQRINDTKAYAVPMGMAYPVASLADLVSPELTSHLSQRKAYADFNGVRLNDAFAAYLRASWLNPELVASGEAMLRAKPMKGTYGCYGHVRGVLASSDFRGQLRSNIHKRGLYAVQPEMRLPLITDAVTGRSYTYIDRVFFAHTREEPYFLGGFRSLMPADSCEAHKGRNHGNCSTVWAEVV